MKKLLILLSLIFASPAFSQGYPVSKGGGGGVNEWQPSIVYATDTIVHINEFFYKALTPHTSSATFPPDLASNLWVEMADNLNREGNGNVANDAVVVWDGTDGDNVKTSPAILTATGSMTGLTQVQVANINATGNEIQTLDTNGNLSLVPNGTGRVVIPYLPGPGVAKVSATSGLEVGLVDMASEVSGVLPIANGGTATSTPLVDDRMMISLAGAITYAQALLDGQIFIGQSGGAPVAANITGTVNQVNVANGAGSITLSAPQDIHSTATPTFAGLTVPGPVNASSVTVDQFLNFPNLGFNSVLFTSATGTVSTAADFTFFGNQLNVPGVVNATSFQYDTALFTPLGGNRVMFTSSTGVASAVAGLTYDQTTGELISTGSIAAGNLQLETNTLNATSGNLVMDTDDATGVIQSLKPHELAQQTTPATPATGNNRFYSKGTDHLYNLKDTGIEQRLSEGDHNLDFYYKEPFVDVSPALNFASGNNATFLGAGGIDGTLSDETAVAIAGATSLSYVSTGASSIDDWVASPIIDLDPKQKGRDNGISLHYSYTGGATNVQLIVWDETNSQVLTDSLDVLATSASSTEFTTSFFVPPNTTQIRWGIQVKGMTAANTLLIDDVQISTSPFVHKDTIEQSTIFLRDATGRGSGGEAATVQYGTIVAQTGAGLSIANGNGSVITVNKAGTLHLEASVNTGGTARLSLNAASPGSLASPSESLGQVAPSTGAGSHGVGWSGKVVPGDVIRLSSNVGIVTNTAHTFSATLIATAEHVVVPAKSNLTDLESYTPVFQGMGSPTSIDFKWSRIGKYLKIVGTADSGAPTAVEAQFGLPIVNGVQLTVASEVTGGENLGRLVRDSMNDPFTVIGTAGDSFVNFADEAAPFTPLTGTGFINNGNTFSMEVMIPIEEWKNDGTNFLAALPVQRTVYYKHIVTSGTSGGTCTSGSFQTRTLNTAQGDTTLGTLSANQITLAGGKYQVFGICPAHRVDAHQCKLRNITDSTDDILGSSESTSAGDVTQTTSTISGTIEFTGVKVFELQHRCSTTRATDGFGVNNGFGNDQVYGLIQFTKIKE